MTKLLGWLGHCIHLPHGFLFSPHPANILGSVPKSSNTSCHIISIQ